MIELPLFPWFFGNFLEYSTLLYFINIILLEYVYVSDGDENPSCFS